MWRIGSRTGLDAEVETDDGLRAEMICLQRAATNYDWGLVVNALQFRGPTKSIPKGYSDHWLISLYPHHLVFVFYQKYLIHVYFLI